jgi:hypothetical protein
MSNGNSCVKFNGRAMVQWSILVNYVQIQWCEFDKLIEYYISIYIRTNRENNLENKRPKPINKWEIFRR